MTPPAPHSCKTSTKNLRLEQAKSRILQHIPASGRTERIGLNQALGRVLAEPVHTQINVPLHACSAMDGYAVCAEDVQSAPSQLTVIGQSFAGHPFEGRVTPGSAVRIMTGAVVPDGADTIVIQENTNREADIVTCLQVEPKGRFVRPAGSDLAQGHLVLDKGQKLGPADLGLLASIGCSDVVVAQAPRVALLSTGDEVKTPGTPLEKGQLYDSNRPTLRALLAQAGAQVLDLGVVADDPEALHQRLREAADSADLILSTGGVSVGEADYVRDVLESLGRIELWKIAMKPGKPLTFAQIDQSVFFGLPGNPVSAMVTFYQFVQPALYALQGHTPDSIPTLKARCDSRIKKEVGRLEFQRGIASQNAAGEWQVTTTGLQESHALHSMSLANCFMVLPLESDGVQVDDWVDIQLLSSYQAQ